MLDRLFQLGMAQRLLREGPTSENIETGVAMPQPPKTWKVSFFEKREDSSLNKDGQAAPKLDELRSTDAASPTASNSPSGSPSAASWSEALACEARNSLQVVLSGAEILLEDHPGTLRAEQRALLTKIMDNASHLCNLISLLGPEECKLDPMSADEIVQIRRVMGKPV